MEKFQKLIESISLIPPIILWLFIIIPIITSAILAYYSSLWAEKFKTLKFLMKFYEIMGWFMIIFSFITPLVGLFWPKLIPLKFSLVVVGGTLGIPLGFALIMLSQFAMVQMEIADNTRETVKLLKGRMG